jgi:hypothetical protein
LTTKISWMPPRWLALILAAIVVAAIGYGFWWRYTAGLLESTLTAFRDQGADQGVVSRWDTMTVSGFPLRLRASLDNPRYDNRPALVSWRAEGLTVEMLPWSLSQFVLLARGPQSLRLGDNVEIDGEARESALGLIFRGDGMPRQLDVAAKEANFAISPKGAPEIGLAGEVLAFHWRIDPDDADPKDGQDYDVALNGSAIKLTGVELPFGPDVQNAALQVTLRGVPALQGTDGAMDLVKWRRAGAPLTIRKLSFVSGGVDIQGGGDLRLSAEGILEGQIGLNIGGLDKVVELLSRRGAIPPEAKTTLFVTSTMLAAAGAKVPMPLEFKNGKAFLGPAPIGPAPRIVF